MESKAGNLQGARQLQWGFSRARVALALVLVKIRPSGVSAREHAEALASSLKSLDEGWKKEARELQREVLRLRQELLMSRAAAAVASSGKAAGPEDTVDPASQDLFGPECVVHSTSETPELQPSVPSQRVREGDSGLEALWLGPDGEAGPLLEDAVCQLLAWLVKACKDPPPLGPGDLGLQACRAVAQATDLLCSRRPPSAEFRRRVEASLEELTEMLLQRDLFSQLPAADVLTRCLLVLGSSSASKPFLIRHLLTRLSGVAEQLWRVLQSHCVQNFRSGESCSVQEFPLVQLQNSFHLFRVVEALLRGSQLADRLEGPDDTGFLAHLERRVFLLSEEFPLFSMCLWVIGGLLTSARRPGSSSSGQL
ncbi:unnamed protein product [Tetraodon nigroviridis]|uniref:(spotted green pufferfish) hypothetical protein n=1 Tax=Tetraodon nigroviridis TaxID=99883 RepID=Q4TB04_TETNG|nr:unnamed protein product [Tetraodon nigroviridis]